MLNAETSTLFLAFNHWAALGAAFLFCLESLLLGLALAGGRKSAASRAAARP